MKLLPTLHISIDMYFVTLRSNLSKSKKKGGTFPRQCIQFHLLLFPAHIEFNFLLFIHLTLLDLDMKVFFFAYFLDFKRENKSGFIKRELKERKKN